MASGKRKKEASEPVDQTAAKVPPVPWTANDFFLLWRLLDECEKEENRKVLFGKQGNENSSSEHKISVCKRIAEVIIPDTFAINATTAAERVRSKIAAEQKCPFFPRLHCLLCTRPNVIPIAVTTGVGPQGASTIHYQIQPPLTAPAPLQRTISDSLIDPALRNVDVNQVTATPARATQVVNAQDPATPATVTPSSTENAQRLATAMAKARGTIKLVPKKRTFEDRTWFEMGHNGKND
ncbi:hypothetical protein C8Q76DRAFT_635374 [Earliella scabrosa]|nr:hypothetical protein C8Q76DRAFT_635374 [Earliella scabrosa]